MQQISVDGSYIHQYELVTKVQQSGGIIFALQYANL
jgi:hypothetical protein